MSKCAIILAEGFEECEGLIQVDLIRRAGVSIDTVSIKDARPVKTAHGIELLADVIWRDFKPEEYDVLLLPGGKLGVENLMKFEPLFPILKEHAAKGKLTCAICAGPAVLGKAGLLEGRNYTCFPTFASDAFGGHYEMELSVKDGNIITGRGMGATVDFTFRVLREIVDEKTVKDVEYGIQYEHTFLDYPRPDVH